MTRVRMMTEMSWEVDEEVNRDKTGDWRGWRNKSWSWFQRQGDAYLNELCDIQGGDGWRARKSDNRWGAASCASVRSHDNISSCQHFWDRVPLENDCSFSLFSSQDYVIHTNIHRYYNATKQTSTVMLQMTSVNTYVHHPSSYMSYWATRSTLTVT